MAQSNKVLVTGSSALPLEHEALARELGHRLMLETSCVLVTGGLRSKGDNILPALDGIVAEAARDALKGDPDAVSRRIITMLPQPERDPANFSRAEIGTVIRVPFATRPMRRNAMVIHSDAVIAIGGSEATREVIDLAFIALKPLILLPATGGAAEGSWKDFNQDIKSRLQPSLEDIADLEDKKILTRGVAACLRILKNVLSPRCFIAMPFSNHPLPPAGETIKGVVKECGYQVMGLGRKAGAGNIVEDIWDSIHHCDIAIIDLSDHRPNVYYEMGIAHALRKTCVLLVHSKDGTIPSDIPFDIRVNQIFAYSDLRSLKAHLKAQLPLVKTHSHSRHH